MFDDRWLIAKDLITDYQREAEEFRRRLQLARQIKRDRPNRGVAKLAKLRATVAVHYQAVSRALLNLGRAPATHRADPHV